MIEVNLSLNEEQAKACEKVRPTAHGATHEK